MEALRLPASSAGAKTEGQPDPLPRRPGTEPPLAQWHIGENLIGQQSRSFSHPAGATAGAKTPLLAGKCHQALEIIRQCNKEKRLFSPILKGFLTSPDSAGEEVGGSGRNRILAHG